MYFSRNPVTAARARASATRGRGNLRRGEHHPKQGQPFPPHYVKMLWRALVLARAAAAATAGNATCPCEDCSDPRLRDASSYALYRLSDVYARTLSRPRRGNGSSAGVARRPRLAWRRP